MPIKATSGVHSKSLLAARRVLISVRYTVLQNEALGSLSLLLPTRDSQWLRKNSNANMAPVLLDLIKRRGAKSYHS